MMLQSVIIESWKCFEGPTRFDFDPGLNVVHAPNGSGKSSLFQAIRSAFIEGHDTSKGDIRSAMPWGATKVGPSVEIHFMNGKEEYRLRKKFLVDKRCELFLKKNGNFSKDTEGKSADEAVLKILDQALDPGKKEKWLLSRILLAHQGKLAIDSLSDDLQRNIRTVLSAQVGSAGPYEELIQTRYSRYFTPTGRFTSGAKAPQELASYSTEYENIKKDLEIVRSDYENYERLSKEVSDLGATVRSARENLDGLKAGIAQLEQRKIRYSELLNKQTLLSAESARERLVYSNLEQSVQAIHRLSGQIAQTNMKISEISEKIPLKKEEQEKAIEKHREMNVLMKNLRKLEESLASQRISIQNARDFVKISSDLDNLRKCKSEADSLTSSIQSGKDALSSLKAPDKKTISRVRKLKADAADAAKTLELSLIRLELTPEVDLSLEIFEAGETQTRNIAAQTPMEISGSPVVMARIPGIVKMKVSGPEVSVDRQKLTLEKSRVELAAIRQIYGTTDLDELEKMMERAAEIGRDINKHQTDLEKIINCSDIESMIRKIRTLDQEIKNILFQYPQWENSILDPDKMERDNQQAMSVLIPKIRELEPDLKAVEKSLSLLFADLERLPKELQQAENELKNYVTELADKEADGKSREQRLADRDTASMKWTALTTSLDVVMKQLKDFGDDPERELEKLRSDIRFAENRVSQISEELFRKSTILEVEAEKSPYSRLTTMEERLGELEKLLDRELIRRDAVDLLKKTLDQRRAQALSGIAEPVELRATEIMKRIGGSKFTHVGLKNNFLPEGVRPGTMQDDVSLENISGGEAEQLHLAVRIALAETLVKNGKHFMLLDDVLTATDSQRMDNILDIITEMTERFQIIIMTCHPERYTKLASARFIDLARAS